RRSPPPGARRSPRRRTWDRTSAHRARGRRAAARPRSPRAGTRRTPLRSATRPRASAPRRRGRGCPTHSPSSEVGSRTPWLDPNVGTKKAACCRTPRAAAIPFEVRGAGSDVNPRDSGGYRYPKQGTGRIRPAPRLQPAHQQLGHAVRVVRVEPVAAREAIQVDAPRATADLLDARARVVG